MRRITHHEPSCPQEKNHSKNVDHAGGEDAIPRSKKHRLPHEQLNLPPGLGLRLRYLEESKASGSTSRALEAGCKSGATASHQQWDGRPPRAAETRFAASCL